jgi:hypothetical protein
MSGGVNPLLGFVSESHETPKDEQDNLERSAKKVKEGEHQFNHCPRQLLSYKDLEEKVQDKGLTTDVMKKGVQSYKDSVLGTSSGQLLGGWSQSMEMSDEEELVEDEEDEKNNLQVEELQVGGYDCPTILLSQKEESRIYRPWKRGVIVKMLGRKIGYKALENRLKQMWVRSGVINIVDLGNDYFLVTFTSKEDQYHAMMNGPWLIYDHYLTVREWTPNFNPSDDHIEKVAVWVRFSGLPIEYYDAKVLTFIGNRIGRTVKVDRNTLQQDRGNMQDSVLKWISLNLYLLCFP